MNSEGLNFIQNVKITELIRQKVYINEIVKIKYRDNDFKDNIYSDEMVQCDVVFICIGKRPNVLNLG